MGRSDSLSLRSRQEQLAVCSRAAAENIVSSISPPLLSICNNISQDVGWLVLRTRLCLPQSQEISGLCSLIIYLLCIYICFSFAGVSCILYFFFCATCIMQIVCDLRQEYGPVSCQLLRYSFLSNHSVHRTHNHRTDSLRHLWYFVNTR